MGTLQRSIRECGIRPDRITDDELRRLIPMLDRRTRLYVDPVRHARLKAELAEIGNGQTEGARTVVIKVEADISAARQTAKLICEAAGARAFITHKVVTAVSELARNIVHYTPGGTVEIELLPTPISRVHVVAMDGGPGILNLDEIMSGAYRSKTGMGRGLIAVQRLSDRCKINPGPPGTRIEIEVYL